MRPVRQDHLDRVVWYEVLRLLEDPGVIQAEIDRRRETAQRTDPLKHREDALRRDEVRLGTNIDRLVTAYQEGLMTLEQLRGRIPELRKRQQGVQAELRSLAAAATDETQYLRLVETFADFRTRLRVRAQTLDIRERQKILRLVVNEIVVGHDSITIRHSIPVPDADPEPTGGPRPPPGPSRPRSAPSYLLRSGSQKPIAFQYLPGSTGRLCRRHSHSAIHTR
jgi:site-specific DNA recombinase